MGSSIEQLLNEPIVAINLGLKSFANSLEEQQVEVIHVSWSPPAGGDQEMLDLLDNLL